MKAVTSGKHILYGVAPTPEEHEMDKLRRVYYTNAVNAAKQMAEVTPGGLAGYVVTLAVGLGRLDGKPPNVSKLSWMTGIPRTTVLRTLELLEADGWVRCEREENRTLVYSTLDAEPAAHQARIDQFVLFYSDRFKGEPRCTDCTCGK